MKARGETVPKVHSVNKELDPHRQPEQQYLSKVAIPKKNVSSPKSVTKEVSQPVRDAPPNIPTDNSGKDLVEGVRVVPRRRPQSCVLLPRPVGIGACEKGDMNGESVESENTDGRLKYTWCRYNLGIDMGEGEEILDPEIKLPEESDFYEPEPLDQVVDVNKQWYKFLPKQGDVDKILAKINHKILRDTKLPLTLKDLKAAYLTSPHFKKCISALATE